MRFEKITLKNGNTIVDTGLPQRGLKPAALAFHLATVDRVMVASADDLMMKNGAARRAARDMVNTILDTAKRDEAIENIERLIKEELGADIDSLSRDEREMALGDIWVDIGIREFMEYLDQAFGVTHRLAIGSFGAGHDSKYSTEEPEPAEDTEMSEEWKEVVE